jgi:pimeloyl-ACP methyl ester carboxylesterase
VPARGALPVDVLEARYTDATSRFVEVDGLRLHYRDRGDGPALVLLHGAMSSLHTWEGWVQALSRDHRVVTVDLPGHGLTGPDPRHRYTTADGVRAVAGLADAIGLDRFTIGGSSLGGRIAWAYAVLHPERLTGLILVSAAGYDTTGPPGWVRRLVRVPAVGAGLTHLTPRRLVAAQLRTAYGDPSRLDAATVDRYLDLLRRAGNRDASRRRLLTDPGDRRLLGRLGEVTVPTLVLCGALDRWVPVEDARRFAAAIPGARLVLLPGLGHVPMEEDPAGTAAVAAEHLVIMGD